MTNKRIKSYFIIPCFNIQALACFEHFSFLTVKVCSIEQYQLPYRGQTESLSLLNSTTSFLTATTLIYAIGAGITAAAGTRLALQWLLTKGKKFSSLQSQTVFGSLFLVTTSLSQDWVIYASAAILRCGSRFSGSLSGIEP